MRWSENETCQFVQLYLDYESLWNTEHGDYKIKEKRLKAYKHIISDFHSSTGISLSVSELKVKIKNLRSTYSQELSKIKQRSGPDYTYKPTIKWFAYWHKRFRRDSRTNQISDTLYEETEKDSKMWVHDHTDNLNEETHIDSFIPENNDDYILLLKSEPEGVQLKTDNNSNTYKTKRKKIKHRSLSTTSEGTFRGSLDSSDKEDEFDIYGKYIASQLRSMDLKKALNLQLEIQSLVSEARLSDLSNE